MQVVHAAVPGRMRCRVEGLRGSRRLRDAIEGELHALPGIISASASDITGTVLVLTDPLVGRKRVLAVLIVAIRANRKVFRRPAASGSANGRQSQPRNRWRGVRASLQRLLGAEPPPAAEWHAIPPAEAAERLSVGTGGLTNDGASLRLRRYGQNVTASAPVRSEWQTICEQLNSLPVALLGAAALIALATGALVDALVILAVVGVNATVGYVTERQSERVIRSFSRLADPTAPALRDGREQQVDVRSLVPGDVLVLRQGTLVAADARLIDATRLTVDESALTGESVPSEKRVDAVSPRSPIADRSSMVYRGTLVTGGQGHALVVGTGMHTEIGAVQDAVNNLQAGVSPLQLQLGALGRNLTLAGIAVCIGVFGIGLLRGLPFLQMLQTAISLAVSAIPEGLPAVATTTLALGIARLRIRGVVIRQLAALETLGSIQTLCLDKTGTITENRMTVVSAWADGRRIDRLEQVIERLRRKHRRLPPPFGSLLRLAALSTETRVATNGIALVEGSSTEVALVEAAARCGMDVLDERRRRPLHWILHRAQGQNFMCTVHGRENGAPGRMRLAIVKGSPTEVLALCTHYLAGRCRRLDHTTRNDIERANDQMSGESLRVLGVAYARVPATHARTLPRSMTWVGLVAMSDRIRDGASELMRVLHRAGVRTVMITGDQPVTAAAIARTIGISAGEPLVTVEALQLSANGGSELDSAAASAHVFARVNPGQKLQIVQALQRAGVVVGMTGDGVNDGPALKAANLGIAIGESATDLAREIASVVVPDGRPERLADAVREGRAVYENVQRSIRFLIATNLSETFVIAAGVAAGVADVLSARQLLWINLLSDLWPSLALALEPPGPGVMERAPRAPFEPIVDRAAAVDLAAQAGALAAGSLGAYAWGALRHGRSAHASSLAYVALTTGQLLHALNTRRGAQERNAQLDASIAASLLLEAGALTLPAVRRLMGLTPLRIVDLVVAVGGALVPFLINGRFQPSSLRLPGTVV